MHFLRDRTRFPPRVIDYTMFPFHTIFRFYDPLEVTYVVSLYEKKKKNLMLNEKEMKKKKKYVFLNKIQSKCYIDI